METVWNICRSQKAIEEIYETLNKFEDSSIISVTYCPEKLSSDGEKKISNSIIIKVDCGKVFEMKFDEVAKCSIIPDAGQNNLYGSCISYNRKQVVFYEWDEVPKNWADDFNLMFLNMSTIVAKTFSWRAI